MKVLKIQLLVTIITFCFACKSEAKQEVTQVSKVKEVKHKPVKVPKKKKKIAPLKKNLPNKFLGTSYIGWLQTMDEGETDAVYLEVYFREDSTSMNTYEYLKERLDSVIYDSGEIVRRRVPYDVADQFFALEGLEKITVFNHENEELIQLPLKRVEYLNAPISEKFIAVYEMPKTIMGTSWIAIGDFNQKMPPTKYNYTEAAAVLGLARAQFNVPAAEEDWVENRVTVLESQPTEEYLVAFNKLESAYIGHSIDGVETIYYEGDNEFIISIHALPIEHHGMPLLLTQSVQPETDLFWENLLQFNGKRYVGLERQRIKL